MTRPLWMAGGLVFMALGWIGLVLPMMPGVVFLLLALFCFARGDPAWERRLLDHRVMGPPLRDWRERRSVSRAAKRSALAAMAAAGALSWWWVGYPWALVSIGSLVAVAAWIATRPE